MARPILYSFRRCPYAMRARMGLLASGMTFEWREILLRDKPDAFLAVSDDATVPVLVLTDEVIQESLDIMLWALHQNDPMGMLGRFDPRLVGEADEEFKPLLDRYKYASRHDIRPEVPRDEALGFLCELDERLEAGDYLHGDHIGASDMAIMPFIRQFAHVDLDWFNEVGLPNLSKWLEGMKASQLFTMIMAKHPVWLEGDRGVTVN